MQLWFKHDILCAKKENLQKSQLCQFFYVTAS